MRRARASQRYVASYAVSPVESPSATTSSWLMPRNWSPRHPSTSSASRNSAVPAGCFFARFQATLINSNTISVGACSRWPSISSMTDSAAGSANASAASADASMTLSAIAQLADDVCRAFASGQIQLANPIVDVPCRDHGHVVDRALDQIEQLTLQRAAVPLRACAQPLDHSVGNVLDGEARRHGSIIAPQWNLDYKRPTSSSSSANGRPSVNSGA